ncbi:MAG TPA: hypothetical protein VFL81_00655 [Candidatus Saccharimonadales bacterium]|nr:hypothetical protein [Candidatus Saccharimonadales bacterium]
MPETTTPLNPEQQQAYQELAENDAQSAEDLATLREMAEADAGTGEAHHIEVMGEDGEVQTVKVTDIGKGALKHSLDQSVMAVHSDSWQTDKK